MVAIAPAVTIATYLLYFFFSHPNSHLCTTDQRTASCGKAKKQVCALVEGRNNNSQIKNYYETTMQNACTACQSADVVGYIPGACADVQVCTKTPAKASCPKTKNSVCTFTKTGTGCDLKIDAQTAQNPCHGCDADGSKFFVKGDCDSLNAQVCDDSQRCAGICPLFAQNICVYYTGDDCTEGLCKRSAQSNGCLVCSDPDALFYVNGACTK